MPKFNLYQSLHTTVVGPQGKPVEVQIRTHEMHRRAEYGIAAHWGYKERSPAEDLAWLQRMVDWQQDTDDPTEFMRDAEGRPRAGRGLRLHARRARSITLPDGRDAGRLRVRDPHRGRAPLHRRAGQRAARPARQRARARATPSRSSRARSRARARAATGCSSSHTPRARSKIRQWFSRERRVDAIDTGRDELVQGAAQGGPAGPEARAVGGRSRSVAETMHYADLDALHAAIGEGHVSARAVAQRVQRELRGGEEQLPVTTQRPPRSAAREGDARSGCTSRASTTSWSACRAAARRCPATRSWDSSPVGAASPCTGPTARTRPRSSTQAQRVIEVEWDHDQTGDVRRVGRDRGARPVAAAARRRPGARRAPREHPRRAPSQTASDRVARLRFDFELADPSHLDSILKAVQRVDSVYEAYRVLPGAAAQGLTRRHGRRVRAGSAASAGAAVATHARGGRPDADRRLPRAGRARTTCCRPESDRWIDGGRARSPIGPRASATAWSSRRSSSTSRCSSGSARPPTSSARRCTSFADRGGPPARAPARGHRARRAGVRPAPPDAAVEGLVRRPELPLRAPAEGPVPPALAARRRGARASTTPTSTSR